MPSPPSSTVRGPQLRVLRRRQGQRRPRRGDRRGSEGLWRPAIDTNGEPRRGAQVAELDVDLPRWPAGTRAIVRREKPHAGAQLRLWDRKGLRHQVTLTNSIGDIAALELRHRRHTEIENRIRNLKDCGLERMPFNSFTANAAWMELVLTAADLLAWCQSICLDGDLARAEPRTLATDCFTPPVGSSAKLDA